MLIDSVVVMAAVDRKMRDGERLGVEGLVVLAFERAVKARRVTVWGASSADRFRDGGTGTGFDFLTLRRPGTSGVVPAESARTLLAQPVVTTASVSSTAGPVDGGSPHGWSELSAVRLLIGRFEAKPCRGTPVLDPSPESSALPWACGRTGILTRTPTIQTAKCR